MLEFYETYRDNLPYPSFWEERNVHCRPHFHSSVELTYVLEGNLQASVDGKPYLVDPGEVLIFSSYAVHSFSRQFPSQCILLIVPLDFLPAYEAVLEKKIFQKCVCQDPLVNREILHCMEQILLYRECTEENVNIIKGYVYVIFGLLINSVGLQETAEKNDSLSREILKYLQNNYLAPVSLDLLAHYFGYSKYRFSHIFSTLFGCSLTEYVNTLRSRHAASLLTETKVPLIDVAMNSGFESMRTFYRAFKVCFGVTPSQYRSNYIAKQ
ncbi:AraC family transcriptional regulator [Caproiciproducens sp. LBM24188]|nr:AraC family transcriptional regulator [Oscillospiraceae bacterium]HHV32456.1 AraC family transcriptional regulator [Clostridiales bacterium]